MKDDEIRETVSRVLAEIAPEVEDQDIDPDVNFRDQFDFDSMDFLNFVIALNKALNVEIPEADYPKLSNLNGCISYVCKRLPERQ
ncbi:MAG: acyl carrier protein [Proteobacteria bacterium]|nr:acyl carrier protein [Pseudomonadota bacterium]